MKSALGSCTTTRAEAYSSRHARAVEHSQPRMCLLHTLPREHIGPAHMQPLTCLLPAHTLPDIQDKKEKGMTLKDIDKLPEGVQHMYSTFFRSCVRGMPAEDRALIQQVLQVWTVTAERYRTTPSS